MAMTKTHKLTYEQFHNELFNKDSIAEELGAERFEDLDPDVRAYISHRVAELWIDYKADELA